MNQCKYYYNYNNYILYRLVHIITYSLHGIGMSTYFNTHIQDRCVIRGVAWYAYGYLKFIEIVFWPDYFFSTPGKNNIYFFWLVLSTGNYGYVILLLMYY